MQRAIFENVYWNVLTEISDFICFKIKVVFTHAASYSIFYNQTVCPFQYIVFLCYFLQYDEVLLICFLHSCSVVVQSQYYL